jgi:hypothetical protein
MARLLSSRKRGRKRGRAGREENGMFGVRLQLPNSDYRLPAGLKCKIRFPD